MLQARSLVLMSRTAGLFFVLDQVSAFQNHMNVGGKLSLPIHPDRNGWKPPDDGLESVFSIGIRTISNG